MVREEQWTKPAGGSMLGMGRAVANAKMVEFEFMRIHEDKGEIFYSARPSGQPEASFKLVSLNGQAATFENPQHDFPQRIVYRKQPDDRRLPRRGVRKLCKASPRACRCHKWGDVWVVERPGGPPLSKRRSRSTGPAGLLKR